MTRPVRIISDPGIQRDGTLFDGKVYVDGQWCRWNRALPRKIGGYRMVSQTLPEKVYGMQSYVVGPSQYVHTGSASKLYQQTLNYTGVLLTSSDRTPGAGFVSSLQNNWKFDILYDAVSATNRIIAHAATNLADIANTTETEIFYGDVTATGVLTDTTYKASGGIVSIAPYLMKYGNDGTVDWSVPNKPADFAGAGSGTARITGSKLIHGLPLRGNGSGPAALLWSLDSLLRASFTGGTTIWAFDTISDNVSVLSSSGIVEYDGIYYWAGVGRFQVFNGVVRELPNTMNLDYFFDGLNFQYRQKVFAFKNPRWGEIWWCYPRGSATECTHAVIYNVREGTWYDTKLPGSGRSAGAFAKVFEFPLMMGVDATASTTYKLWKHEEGTNAIDGTQVNPVPSYFETAPISMLTASESVSQALSVVRIEPDFVQSGDMTVTTYGSVNARSPDVVGETFTFPATASQPQQETVPLREVRRLMRFRFGSNTIDGDYQMGLTFAHIDQADSRVQS